MICLLLVIEIHGISICLHQIKLIMCAWVKVFRIIPEFRILRLTFHRMLNSEGNNSFSDLVSVQFQGI